MSGKGSRAWNSPKPPGRYPEDERHRDPAASGSASAWGGPADAPPLPPSSFRPAPRGSHLPPYQEPMAGTGTRADSGRRPGPAPGERTDGASASDPEGEPAGPPAGRPGPRKLTVTRVAAFRSRELTNRGVQLFRRAAAADGADRSGLTNLTYAVMANYALDAALAVALANTLFFAAATAESTGKVLLYLLITVAPFAVVAPFVGPMLDRLQHGRRIALSVSFFARVILALIMAFRFDTWVLYPCALGMLVLSKSFGVLKAALTPRVLPQQITLVKTNSRLTVFGLLAGAVAGAAAGLLAWLAGSPGALVLTAILAGAGGVLCLRIPAWVESTEGEVPLERMAPIAGTRRAFPIPVISTLWTNSVIRVETGFLALFIAFVVKSQYADVSGFMQLVLLGVVGVAAGLGSFVGNTVGARLPLRSPETVALAGLGAVIVATLIATLAPGLATAAIVGLVGSTASSLAKVCLDSVLQRDIPEVSRASAFGRSETALQLSWVFGGVIGLLIGGVLSFGDRVYVIGFGVVSALLILGAVQCWLARNGRSMIPTGLGRALLRPLRRRRLRGEGGSNPIEAHGPSGAGPAGRAPAPRGTGREAGPVPAAQPGASQPASTPPHDVPTRPAPRAAGSPRNRSPR